MSESSVTGYPVQVADQIELQLLDPDTGEIRRYRTNVLDLDTQTLSVATPTDRKVPLAIAPGTRLMVSVWKEYADHVFPSEVLSRESGKIPRLVLRLPDPAAVKRTPRRQFFRVDTRLDTMLHLVETETATTIAAVMLDLSGGGCRLQVAGNVPVNAAVRLDFELPFPPDRNETDQARPMRDVPGRIVFCMAPSELDRRSRARPTVRWLGIQFQTLDIPVHNAILRYVAFRQREILIQLQEGTRAQSKATAEQITRMQDELDRLEADLDSAAPTQASAETSTAQPTPAAPCPSLDTDPASEGGTGHLGENPVHGTARTATVALPLLPPAGRDTRRTILLVDDEYDLRTLFSAALRLDGHSVVCARNGEEGLEMARHYRPDLVMTDLVMPRMNGWRLIKALRDTGIEAPVIIITGYMSQEGQKVLTNRDVAGFLVKPVDLDDMIALVRRIFSTRPARSLHVLAVDDEEDTRLLVSSCLQQAGFTVETADNGREALSRAVARIPDVILLDIAIPEMDGFEIARRLRAHRALAGVPIVMLTARSSAKYVRKAVVLKVDGYLVKPFEPDVLVSRLRRVLQTPATRSS